MGRMHLLSKEKIEVEEGRVANKNKTEDRGKSKDRKNKRRE